MKLNIQLTLKYEEIPCLLLSSADEGNDVVAETCWKCTIEGKDPVEVFETLEKLALMDEEAGSIKQRFLEEAEEIKDRLTDKKTRIVEGSDDRVDMVQEKANNKADRIKEKADSKAEKVKEKAVAEALGIKYKAKEKARLIRDRVCYIDGPAARIEETFADRIEEEAARKSQRVRDKAEIKADKILV